MRWITCDDDGARRVGLLEDDRVLASDGPTSVRGLLEAGGEAMEEEAASLRRSAATVLALEDVALAPPISDPPSVRDALCFLEHMRGCLRAMGQSDELPPVWQQVPAFYFGNANALLGPNDDVAIPPGCRWFDMELEVGAVIGSPGRDIHPDDGERHIAGFTFYCDWTNRDIQQLELQLGIGMGKAKDMATTLGPSLVTMDELDEHRIDGLLDVDLTATVNGRTLTTGSLNQMDWSFGELVAYLSRGVDLLPGDVIGSGTVPGGCLLEHLDTDPDGYEGWLGAGDVVSLASSVLGRTEQTVVAGPELTPLRSGY